MRMSQQSRRHLVRRLLEQHAVGDQAGLVRLLARKGHRVTQATVSRDLSALGAEKAIDGRGRTRYVVDTEPPPAADDDELVRLVTQFVTTIEQSANLVVVRTPPGAASPVAAALDRAHLSELLATVAGDDTVLAVASGPRGGAALTRRIRAMLEG